MSESFNSPFVKVFFFKKGSDESKDTFRPINEEYVVKSLTYKYAEDEDDEAIIQIETADRTIADRQEFQEGACLKVMWGYIGGKVSKARTVYIRDINLEADEVVKLTITATDKAAQLKDTATQLIHSPETEKEGDEFNVIKVITDFCKKHGLVLHLFGLDFDYRINPLNQYQRDNRLNPDTSPKYKDPGYPFEVPKLISYPGINLPGDLLYKLNRYTYYPQANKSDWQLLWEMLKKEQAGPWVLSGRDNSLEVGQRKLNQKPKKKYTYAGGSGELLKVSISVKGQVNESETEDIVTTQWDPENKTFNFNNQTSENTPEDKLNLLEKYGSPALSAVNSALLISGGTKLAAWASKGLKLAKWSIRGVSFLESLGILVLSEAYQKVGDLGSTTIKSDPNEITLADGTKEKRYYGSNGAVIVKVSKMKKLGASDALSQFFRNHDSIREYEKYDITFKTDYQATAQQVELINKLKNSNTDLTKLPSAFQTWAASQNVNTRYSSAHDPQVSEAEAINRKKENDLNKITITAEAIGDPSIEDKSIITLHGMGNKYSGNYYVKKVEHTISSDMGYKVIYHELVSNSQGNADVNSPNIKLNENLPGNINVQIGEEVDTMYSTTVTDNSNNPSTDRLF